MDRLAPYPSTAADDAAADILARSRPPELGQHLPLSYSDYPSYPGYQSSLSLYESRSRSSQLLPWPGSAGPSDAYRSEYLNSTKPYGDLGSDYLGYGSAYRSYPYSGGDRNLYQKDDPLDLQNRQRGDLYGRYEASSSDKYGLPTDTKDQFSHFTPDRQYQVTIDSRYGRAVSDPLYKLTDSRDPIYPNLESGHHYEQRTGTSAYHYYVHPESMHFNGKSELDLHRKYYQQAAKADASPSPSLDRNQGQDSSKVTKEGEGLDKSSSQGASIAAEGTGKKKRRSRWEPVENCEGESNENTDGTSKRRKSRWSEEAKPSVIKLPDFVVGGVTFDREVLEINVRLLEINKKLQNGQVIEDKPDGERSPSPEPVYDSLGMRINTREFRAREKLLKERAQLIAEMIKKNPLYKPPADYKISKFQRKLFVPVKENPGYNFVGLIIGPRGLTLKRMEKESGAKIVLRGKGSSTKEGDQKPPQLPEEDLHVLIEGETEESVEKAALLVGKLLVPVHDDKNEHKKAQLRELAALEGKLIDNCKICGESGHMSYTCPLGSNKPVICHLCGNEGHIKSHCPKMDKKSEASQSGLAEGKKPEPSQTPVTADGAKQEKTSSTLISEGSSSSGNSVLHASCLPSSLDDEGLAKLFSLFGDLEHVRVVRDPLNGSSKGYGYVKFSDATAAAQAAALINGYVMDGCKLEVKVASNSLHLAGDTTPMQALRFGSHLAIPSGGGTSCLSPYNFYDPSANHF